MGCCCARYCWEEEEELDDDRQPLLAGEVDQDQLVVEVLKKSRGADTQVKKEGWVRVEIQQMNGAELQLMVNEHATVLQLKRMITRTEGTPTFRVHLWAEGAENELQNTCTVAQSGLEDLVKLHFVKGEAASWQQRVLNEPLISEALEDFIALSKWREAGGYVDAGKVMDAKLAEWEKSASLSECELLRRRIIVARFFLDCGGNYERAIDLVEHAAGEVMHEHKKKLAAKLPIVVQVRLLITLADAYKLRETALPLVQRARHGREGERRAYENLMKAVRAYEHAIKLWWGLPPQEQDEEEVAEALRGAAFGHSSTARFPACPDSSRWLHKAETTASEAVQIYTRLEHPQLGGALTTLGGVYMARYVIANQALQRAGRSSVSPDAKLNRKRAIDLYMQAAAAYVRQGTQDTDHGYPAVLANIGLLHYRGGTEETEQGSAKMALPWWKQAVIAYDTLLGPTHPSSVRARSELVSVLRNGLDLHRDAAAVEMGGVVELGGAGAVEQVTGGEEFRHRAVTVGGELRPSLVSRPIAAERQRDSQTDGGMD
jgi:hypothetical protein